MICRQSQERNSPLYLIAVMALTMLAFSPARAEDWPQYHGPNGDNTTPEKITVTDWPESGLPIVWKVETPTGFSSFSVKDGQAYTLVGETDENGIQREVAVAFNAENGQELWRNRLGFARYDGGGDSGTSDNDGGDGPRSTPSVDGERVYVYDSTLGLYCFDAKTGKTVWEKDLAEAYDGPNIRWQSAASPLLEGDLVIVQGGGKGQSFLAFNKVDGSEVWKNLDEDMTHATPVPATIHGVRQIVFFAQSGLVSVKADTGEKLWSFEHPYKISTAASPVVSGDHVYLSAGYGIGAALCRIVKKDEGFEAEKVWRRQNDLQNHWSTPILKDGHLYGMFSFKEYGDGPLKCVNLEKGEEVWSESGFGPGNVILAGDKLLALSDDGHLVLIDPTPEGYKELARAKVVDGKCWSTPVLSNGRVYVRSTTQGACVDLAALTSQ